MANGKGGVVCDVDDRGLASKDDDLGMEQEDLRLNHHQIQVAEVEADSQVCRSTLMTGVEGAAVEEIEDAQHYR